MAIAIQLMEMVATIKLIRHKQSEIILTIRILGVFCYACWTIVVAGKISQKERKKKKSLNREMRRNDNESPRTELKFHFEM